MFLFGWCRTTRRCGCDDACITPTQSALSVRANSDSEGARNGQQVIPTRQISH
jgi:hypothetical protein